MATDFVPSSRYAIAVTPSVPNANARSGSKVSTLHLDFDDLLDPDPADDLHHDRHGDHHLPDRVLEQHLHVLWIEERQSDGQEAWKTQQHVAGEAPVGRVDAHLPLDLEALAHDVREVVEDLRQIAARLALNQHGRHEEPHVDERHPFGQVVQRLLHRETEILLFERFAELGTDRLTELVGHHLHSGAERVARTDRPRHQVERLREVLLELVQPGASLVADEQEWQGGANRERRQSGPEQMTETDGHYGDQKPDDE